MTNETRISENDVNNPVFYYDRGRRRFALGAHEEAFTDFGKAIELNPNYVDAYFAQGYAWLELDKYEKSIADFTGVICLDPLHAAAYFNRGTAKGNLSRYEDAIADFDTATIVWTILSCQDFRSGVKYGLSTLLHL